MNIFWNAGEQRIRAFWRMGIFVVVWLMTTMVVLIPAVALGMPLDPIGNPKLAAIAYVLQAAAVVFAAWACSNIDRRPFRDYGITRRSPFWRELILGYLIGAVLMAFVFAVLYATGSIQVLSVRLDSFAMTALALYAICHLGVGVAEELVSRGYLQLNLEDGLAGSRLGYRATAWIAVFLTSALFSVMHGVNPNVTPTALVNLTITGMALAVPLLLTRRLGLSIGIHAAWNLFISSVFGFAVSGQRVKDPVLNIRVTGPEWLTGGAFGPEGGVLDIAASILLVLFCALYAKFALGEARVQPPPVLSSAATAPVAGAGDPHREHALPQIEEARPADDHAPGDADEVGGGQDPRQPL